jgi:hypothetical protein
VIGLHIFPDIVGAVSAADLLAAALTGKLVSIGPGGREKLTPVQNPLVRLALAVTGLGILVLVAIDVRHRLGR